MLTPIVFVVMLAVLILSHELGHFITAKRSGVRVLEFGFGYPPRLLALRWGDTEYSLNLLPLGGFVKMVGEEDPQEPGSLAGRGVGTRLLVLSAGSLMNALLAIGLFSGGFMVPREIPAGPVQIFQVAPDSPAEKAGIRPGDIILKINDRRIETASDVHYNIRLNMGSEISMLLQRDRRTQEPVRLVPRWNPPAGQGETGIVIGMPKVYTTTVAYPLWEALPLGMRKSLDLFTIAKNDIISMIVRGGGPQVAGPIGIYQATGEVIRTGWANLVDFTAFLSLNLAVLNILPIPMLDGGRILFVVIEGVRRGKRIPPEREGLVHLVGFIVLMSLIAIISYFDLMRILSGESLFR